NILDEIGFWVSKTSTSDASKRIVELKHFYDEHGKLPTQQSNRSLYEFGRNLRNKYKHKKDMLSPQDLNVLNEIDFWVCKTSVASKRILELKQFYDEHGELPTNRSNKSLCIFGRNLRNKYKHKKDSLSRQDLDTLEEIGFRVSKTPSACERILVLKRFVDEHGELPTQQSNKSLYIFCRNLRKKQSEGKLSLSRQDMEILDEIGFRWGRAKSNSTSSGTDTPRRISEQILELKRFFDKHGKLPTPKSNKRFRWESNHKSTSRLNELKLHFDEHGHFDVAASENAGLARYVINIRSAYNNHRDGGRKGSATARKISDDTISELESIGFTWERSRPRRSPTEKRFKSFEYGRSNPDKGMTVTDERIKALDEIGFSWATAGTRGTRTEANKSFESRLADLRQYKQQHGHLNISRKEDQSLYYFCQNVRTGRNNPSARGMQITDERVRALDEIGFPWGGMKTFEERLDELRKYKRLHGHMNVRWADDISLAAFCSKLRFARKTKKTIRLNLTDAKIAALDSIGFDWF
ncbi:hypothetical protein THAOC_00372, partial [Thalassiosira oceanica]